MADWTSIARPYAKAIFEHACEHNLLVKWSDWLLSLEAVVSAPEMSAFINNPETTATQHAKAVCDVLTGFPAFKNALPEALAACVHLLAQNKRLPIVSDIHAQYEALRALKEARIRVEVRSFSELSETQKERLQERLTKRLQKTVELDVSVDSNTRGGAIISVPEIGWVFDGSVKGQLEKLSAELIAL